MTSAVVIGSGPNGLTAACVLAQAGLSVTVIEAADTVGGGTRSSELTIPGLIHDDCSAVHPTGVSSPAFKSLGLDEFGLRWLWPEVDLAHPLDGGRAAVLRRDIEETARALAGDGDAWRRLFGPLSSSLTRLYDDLLGPVIHIPRHPFALAPFGVRALLPASRLARRWSGDEARALWGGAAAHVIQPLDHIGSAAVGLMLLSAGHAFGWPVAEGGSSAISDALAAKLASLGGSIETGRRVSSLSEIRPADVVILDVSPSIAVEICGSELSPSVTRSYQRFRSGPAAYKVDLAVDGGVPWTNEQVRVAGTVHVAGTFEEMVASEADAAAGRMPERPYVLVAQQSVADPSRAVGDIQPLWAYAHVPNGFTGDATEALLAQIERFAPGFRERIVATHVRRPADMEAYNANYLGGDIAGGANDLWQLVARPRLAWDPYATGIAGVWLASASTPPAGGVHGMCGWNAAHRALRGL